MVHVRILLDGDGSWPDLTDKSKVIEVGTNAVLQFAGLPHGMSSGKPSIKLRLDLPDGKAVLAQTSLALLLMVADAFRARYGDPRDDNWTPRITFEEGGGNIH